MASQITSLTIVYSTVYSGANQRKHQSSASRTFVRGIHWSPANSPHKEPVTRKMFPFDDAIMTIHETENNPLPAGHKLVISYLSLSIHPLQIPWRRYWQGDAGAEDDWCGWPATWDDKVSNVIATWDDKVSNVIVASDGRLSVNDDQTLIQ